MAVSETQKLMLAFIIVRNIKKEFSEKKLSGNLVNTIEVYEDSDGLHVYIPAQTYNMLKYQREGVLIHTSHGSYAQKLDSEGSEFYVYNSNGEVFKIKPHNHVGFVDRIINESLSEWLRMYNMSVGKIERK